MKYFKVAYDSLCKESSLVGKTYDKGLELKLGNFAYDPKTQMYDTKLSKEISQAMNESEKISDEGLELSGKEKFKIS